MNFFVHGKFMGWLMVIAAIGFCSDLVASQSEEIQLTGQHNAAGWHLNTAGQYQWVSDKEGAVYLAQHEAFCQQPRPDLLVRSPMVPTPMHPIFLSNEQGVLRWWSKGGSSQQIWSDGGSSKQQAPEGPALISNQLAVITSPEPTTQLQVVWPEPQLQRYSAVDLSEPTKPKSLWQWQPTMMGSVQTPVVATFKTITGSQTAVITVSGRDAAQPAFWLIDAKTGQMIASQLYSRSKKTVELPFILQDITAAPAVLDRNADGYIDRIYLVDLHGRLVQVDVTEQMQFQSRVVADLSDAGARFEVQLVTSRSLLPDPQLTEHGAEASALSVSVSKDPQKLTEGAGSLGQAADLLVLVSTKQDQSRLWLLTIPDSPAFTIQTHHLTKRDLSVDDSGQLKGSAKAVPTGWYADLPALPVSLPQIFAGVLYLPVAATSDTCAGARQATQLIARHVFEGTSVYDPTDLASIPTPFGALAALQRSSGELALQDSHSGTLLLPQLQGIRADCRFCTVPLHQQDYPKWHHRAIYQHESEIYR